MSHYPKYSDIIGSGAGPSVQRNPYIEPDPIIPQITEQERALNMLRDQYRMGVDIRRWGVPLPRNQRDPRIHGLSQTSDASSRRDARIEADAEREEREMMNLEDIRR
jgi:hypothetical protein